MRILCERQQDSLSSDLSWLDQLIEQERAGRSSAPPLAAGAAQTRLVPLASASQLHRTAPGLAASTSYQIGTFSPVKDGM